MKNFSREPGMGDVATKNTICALKSLICNHYNL